MPGKFEGNSDPKLAEYLYEMSLAGWVDEEKGESDYSGWHCLFIFDKTYHFDDGSTQLPVKFVGMDVPENIQRAYVCTEDAAGFFTCTAFDSEDEARKHYNELPDWGANDALMDMTEEEVTPTCDEPCPKCGHSFGKYFNDHVVGAGCGDCLPNDPCNPVLEDNPKIIPHCLCTPASEPAYFDEDGDGIAEMCRRCGEYISYRAEEKVNG